jgi:hypothetical protein
MTWYLLGPVLMVAGYLMVRIAKPRPDGTRLLKHEMYVAPYALTATLMGGLGIVLTVAAIYTLVSGI